MAVRDPDKAGSLPRKAAALAVGGARIELFHASSDRPSLATSGMRQAREAVQRMREAAVSRTLEKLQRLARSPDLRGFDVSTHVTRDRPAADAIVRRALTTRADLIVAGIQPRRFAGRLLLVNTDWELIRESPCDLLLAKSSGRYRQDPVIAALDPFHANDKPARLDRKLLAAARIAAARLHSETHVFHAYAPLAAIQAATATHPIALYVPELNEARHARAIGKRVDALAHRARIPPAQRHVLPGDVSVRLAAVVRRTRAQIAVMGAVSRSGLKRVFIGNTAERVLDRLPCDLLVVKPARFRTRVPREPVAAV